MRANSLLVASAGEQPAHAKRGDYGGDSAQRHARSQPEPIAAECRRPSALDLPHTGEFGCLSEELLPVLLAGRKLKIQRPWFHDADSFDTSGVDLVVHLLSPDPGPRNTSDTHTFPTRTGRPQLTAR
jgi:hypothetical protein